MGSHSETTSPELLHSQDRNNTLKAWLSWEPPLQFYRASCIHPCFPLALLHIPEISPSRLTQQLKTKKELDNKAEVYCAEYC